jgi:carbon-monoxide dehydrogenase small subunit
MTITVHLTVNGMAIERPVEPRRLLGPFLREDLGLTGTHIGCDTSQCGCCTVLIDGEAIKSCTMLVVQADGRAVTTIEGLGTDGRLHPVQQAFHDHHGLQCGFCTPGFVMSITELVTKYDDLTETKVRELIEGNLCRCTGYHNIVKAALAAAAALKGQ